MNQVMTKLVLALAMVTGASAFADGFICSDANGDLRLKVYDKTQPKEGTKDAAIMIVSNPSATPGNQTIATFNSDDSLLANDSSSYTAEVDLRYNTSNQAGADIGGTQLGQLKYITLDVDFSYSNPVPNGTVVSGEVTLTKRDNAGDVDIAVNCTRYLKQ